MQSRRSTNILDAVQEMHPAVVIMGAVLLAILGVLIILYPPLLRWVVGIGLLLAGVGVFATVVIPAR